MDKLNISPKAEQSLQRLQDVTLSPMEEALFQAWTKANQIDKPNDPTDSVDYRGIWKATNGQVLPRGELKVMAEMQNHSQTLEKALQERMMERITEVTGKKEDLQKQQFDAQRKDVDHKHKMEQGSLKLKQAPFDLQMREHDIKGKELDLHKQRMGLDQQKLGNEGKEIDLITSLMQPAGAPTASPTQPSKPKY